jgi:hypothetical protein
MIFPPASVRRHAAAALARGLTAWIVACIGATGLARQPAPPAADDARVVERRPEIYYLENDTGGLVPVPGFRYRDFVELMRLKEGLPGPPRPPAAVLEDIRVVADLAAADAGTCPATVVCTIRQARRGWVEVPLGCQELILSAAPRHEGPGRLLVDAAADGRGYRAWLDAVAEADQEPRHTVTLEGRLPIDTAAGREAVVLHLPTATASSVELRSSRADPQVVVQPAAADTAVRAGAAGGSVVTLSGVAGPLTISVAERSASGGGRPPDAEAVVESVVRIDGRDAVTQARIRLGGLAERTPTVRITLPPAATLRSVRPPATVVGQGGGVDAPVVDVAVVRGADGKAVIELECARPLDRVAGAKEAGPFELGGFAVEGIEPWRQWGRISLVVEGDWQAVWSEGLRRVDPPAAGRRPGLVAAFAYDAQPATLAVRVLPRRSRVVIEPEYRYDVSAERIALQARLRVAASGAPATEIIVNVDPAWSIDEVGPATIVDTARVTAEGGRLVIPFAQPLVGNAVVEVRGGRAVERDAEELAWRLPAPASGLVGPATVVVGADSNIELLPDNERIKGLVRQTAAALSRNETDEVVLAYRLDARQGEFAATRRYLPQRVDATVAVQAVMDDAVTVVTETIRLQVVHVPLEFVELLVPEAAVAAGTLEVRQGDAQLDPIEVPDAGDAVTAAGMRRLRAILPGPLLGGGEIVVRTTLPTPAVPAETTVAHDLPLVLPVGARVTRQTLVLDAPDRLSVEMRGDAWRRDANPQSGGARVWSTVRQQAAVPLALAARRGSAGAGLVVDAALLRTTVLADRREDHFTYALSGAAERLEFTPPVGTLEVRFDGQPVAATPRPDGRVALDLPRGGSGRWLLEVHRRVPPADGWLRLASRLGLPARVPLDPPRFAADVAERRFAWEVNCRPDERLVGAPGAWTAQQHWEWPGLLPDRVPGVSREALVAWVRAAAGAEAAGTLPPAAGRRAVYTGIGPPGAATVWVLPVWFLVLLASGATLGLGLAALRSAAVRRPSWALALAAASVLGAAAAPDTALLATVAGLPGVLLTGLAWLLQRLTGSDAGRRAGIALPSASSLTRAAAAPSLIVGGSAARADSVTAAGRAGP